ncbi:MAG: ATP-binding cassette domain-containing protein [Dehalococcoidales bacterium]|nr:ATP-binding cassette domain-containing protein [Dehalococcoidales bacterium]
MIRIENITKNFGDFSLKDVSLDIADGEYMVILGPTGAGKTILLEIIAGIYRPEKGRMYRNDVDITDLPPRMRNTGMVYQDYMLFPHLSVKRNINFGLKPKKLGVRETGSKLDQLAELLGISHLLERYPGTLSGGEKQRVAIARALIIEPEILLLDEPLSALDDETKDRLQDELRRIHTVMHTTMLHVTHSFNEAFLLGSRMAVMNKGEIIQVGEPEDVFRKPNSRFVAEFLGVRNIFSGISVIEDETSYINVNGLRIASSNLREGDIQISIRPEDILIFPGYIESSAKNTFRGKIEEISDTGTVVRVKVNAGIPFIVAITRRSLVDMRLRTGMDVFLTFKSIDVHMF